MCVLPLWSSGPEPPVWSRPGPSRSGPARRLQSGWSCRMEQRLQSGWWLIRTSWWAAVGWWGGRIAAVSPGTQLASQSLKVLGDCVRPAVTNADIYSAASLWICSETWLRNNDAHPGSTDKGSGDSAERSHSICEAADFLSDSTTGSFWRYETRKRKNLNGPLREL